LAYTLHLAHRQTTLVGENVFVVLPVAIVRLVAAASSEILRWQKVNGAARHGHCMAAPAQKLATLFSKSDQKSG
jgi:hypothetical protein